MAAVNVDRRRSFISGSMREVVAQVDIATDGDTFVTGLKRIESVSATPSQSSATQVGTTISGGTVTFKVGGAENNVLVRVVGQ
jgi:hypothetical protein